MSTDVRQSFRYSPIGGAATAPLLALFASSVKSATGAPRIGDAGHHALWAADTLHRANNIAQMLISIGYIAPRRAGGVDDGRIRHRAELLAGAYAELAVDGACETPLPCGPILERIVVGLVRLFGEGIGPLHLQMRIDALALPGTARRALVLIASELTINALKYAFVPGEPGTLVVSLLADERGATLSVEDDGVGLGDDDPTGDGTPLLGALAALLEGTLALRSSPNGLCATLTFRP